MFIGYFTERPYQDPDSGFFGMASNSPFQDLGVSNGIYNPKIGAQLYNRYLDEKVYAEEVGFDCLMLNEHHSTPFCMGGTVNVEAAILARITKRAKIAILGNIIPLWEDPLWLVEQLSEIDMISHGRLISGWVRGGPRESVSHDIPPAFNWERYQEAHDFIVKAWTTPGPWRWEGKHYHYRYVNPWSRPYQNPHPPIMIPGVVSRNTVDWTAAHRFPYTMLATQLEPTKQSFDYYYEVAERNGYKAGTQNLGYLFKVHVDETEDLAEAAGRKFVQGPSNPFLVGNEGQMNAGLQALPGHTDRRRLLPSAAAQTAARFGTQPAAGAARPNTAATSYEAQTENYSIISGTPKTVIPKIRHVLEYLRPGNIFFWDGDGAQTHEEAMRSLRLFGAEVIPAVREMGKELNLNGLFEVSPTTGERLSDNPLGEQGKSPVAGLQPSGVAGSH